MYFGETIYFFQSFVNIQILSKDKKKLFSQLLFERSQLQIFSIFLTSIISSFAKNFKCSFSSSIKYFNCFIKNTTIVIAITIASTFIMIVMRFQYIKVVVTVHTATIIKKITR